MFPIDNALDIVRDAVKPWPKAAMFALRDEGFASPFEQLISCLLSVRTYDEVSIEAARQLLGRWRTPEELADRSADEIDAEIRAVTFHERKAQQIIDIAQRVRDEFGGKLPCNAVTMQSFSGIGPKCANLAAGVACGAAGISVDIHVHRVTNRWGYVHTKTPEQTMVALEEILPKRYWIEINERLVPFGKHVCTGVRPHCSVCPVRSICAQVGVTDHR